MAGHVDWKSIKRVSRSTQDSLRAFLNGEAKVLLFATALAFVVMSALFFLPAFGIRDVADMDIVAKVVLPGQLLIVIFIVGTLANGLIHLLRINWPRNGANDRKRRIK